jgi:hypothetical protein
MDQAVQITFDCLPLRSVGRLDVPLDASTEYRARCQQIKQALETHGSTNTYYLANAHAVFRLVNSDVIGMLRFAFEGTVTTAAGDQHTQAVDLDVHLVGQTCEWLTEAVEAWFAETVRRAVAVEFDRFIHSGNLSQTVARLDDAASQDDTLGMYL